MNESDVPDLIGLPETEHRTVGALFKRDGYASYRVFVRSRLQTAPTNPNSKSETIVA
jgi:hypothetical protein